MKTGCERRSKKWPTTDKGDDIAPSTIIQ